MHIRTYHVFTFVLRPLTLLTEKKNYSPLSPKTLHLDLPRATALGFSTFDILFFPFFLSFGFLFAAVIGLLLGLLGVKKWLRKSH